MAMIYSLRNLSSELQSIKDFGAGKFLIEYLKEKYKIREEGLTLYVVKLP